MMQTSKCVETDVADLRNCKLVYELADPEFTPVCAKNQARMRSLYERVRGLPSRWKYLFLAFPVTKPVLGYVLAEPKFTFYLLMFQGNHVCLGTW